MRDEIRKQIRERLLDDEAARASISLRAYEIYERRGCAPGCELEDWLRAENEILPLLIEEELQRGTVPRASSDDEKAEQPVPTGEKPAKEASRLFRRGRSANKDAIGH
jgi:hypothetical protein